MGKLTSFADDAYPTAIDTAFPPGAEFSLATARVMAWASQLAYETEAAGIFGRIIRGWGWGPVLPVQFMTDLGGRQRFARGYVAHVAGAVIVAFCGTEPDLVSDILIDLNLVPRGGNVSPGMQSALDAVWETVRSQIGGGATPVYLTGHSLGGAFAVLAARKLAAEQPAGRVRGVYTFGMPRIGDPAFAADYNAVLGDRTYRLVHGEDVVANIPPTRFFALEFRHVGRLLHCRRHGTFPPVPEASCHEAPLGRRAALRDLADRLFSNLPAAILKATGLAWDMQLSDEPCPQDAPRRPHDFPARYRIAEQLIPMLAPQARDHVMDGYFRALGQRFRGD